MDINKILSELDGLFAANKLDEIEDFLKNALEKSVEEKDTGASLSIVNELIGFYREMTIYDKAYEMCGRAEELLTATGLLSTAAGATTFVNIANACRAMGRLPDSHKYYDMAERIFKDTISEDDFRWASLYNNLSLLYQAEGNGNAACESLYRAMEIVKKHKEAKVELAVTYTNLAQAYMQTGETGNAEKYLKRAEELFEEIGKNDYHYCGCANAFGELYFTKGDYEKSVKYYEEALLNMYDTAGRTANFKNIYDSLMLAYKMAGLPVYNNMLELCEAYYEEYGRPMIREKFPEYADRIAAGLCGEGSECYGFEDEISMDHDCGPGFAMWMSDEVYNEIGEDLNEEYNKLPRIFAGRIRSTTGYGRERCGACTIKGFYRRILLTQAQIKDRNFWENVDEAGLAAAVNGRVFEDKMGEFTSIRNQLLAYYPYEVWIERLYTTLIKCAQTGQYNYGRMMAREDYVSAQIALSDYMKEMMKLIFLLNRRYAPYYKWLHRGTKDLLVLPEIGDMLTAICDMPSQREAWKDYEYNGQVNNKDMIALTIEIIAKLVVDRLHKMGLSESDDAYLEVQAKEVLSHMNDRDKKIDYIVKLEWEQFDKVSNEGGRASCQDDWETFSIMRKSQYMTWDDDMLDEIIWYFRECIKQGRNLITEKYARMMESTVPWEYEKIKDALPPVDDRKRAIIEEIVKIQVSWMEEFAGEYPCMAANARSVHTSEDRVFNTSYETYLRGELMTYSDELIAMYGRFVAKLVKESKNLAKLTMMNTAGLYGYDSLKMAEEALSD